MIVIQFGRRYKRPESLSANLSEIYVFRLAVRLINISEFREPVLHFVFFSLTQVKTVITYCLITNSAEFFNPL
jgi:hypothetical protein